MAYSFDGVDDSIDFGSDASVDAFSSRTVCAWVQRTAGLAQHFVMGKDRYGANWGFGFEDVLDNKLSFIRNWSGSNAKWRGSTAIVSGDMVHIAVTYSDSSTSNDPIIYLNGVLETVSEEVAPAGSANSDATPTLRAGRTGVPGQPFAGLIGFLMYDNTIWTAADVNRHRCWGTRGGTAKCLYPLMTDANNRGSATANGTVSGATLASIPKVERNWGSMMGCGR